MLYLKNATQGRNLNGKRLVVDIDDTICTHSKEHEGDARFVHASPIQKVIDRVNLLHDEGWYIILFTARGFQSRNDNPQAIMRELGGITNYWLQKHGVKFDELRFGKPYGDYYLDDKALSIEDFLEHF